MTRSATLSLAPRVVFAALVLSGCGSNRQLQSVSLNPPSADAQSFPGAQVPFAATGTFSQPPSPSKLTSKDVLWCVGTSAGACLGNINPGTSVDQNGAAQCNPGFVGKATILAGTQSSVMVNPDQGPQLKVFGTAQLTCP
jgi:hypothetical protein